MDNNASGLHEPTLEEYHLDISVYKNYRVRLSSLEGEITKLETNKELLRTPFYISYGLSLLGISLLFYNSENFVNNLLENLLGSIIIAIFPAVFLHDLNIDLISNIFSFGKFGRTKKAIEVIKKNIEELKNESSDKVQLFESAASKYYQYKLEEYFEENLYKKRSGNQQFEDKLSEFSLLIEELSTMNSVFISNNISNWELQRYKEYLEKRKTNHNLQSTKKSEGLRSVHNFVRSFSKLQEQEIVKMIPLEKLYRTARKIDNWEEINNKRILTGRKGQEIAVALEQKYFQSINRIDLADKVCDVAEKHGDGLGYDILSFFEDGREKYIEVKSTTTSLASPFYISRNELEFLKEHSEDAVIYRLYIYSDDDNEAPQLRIDSSSQVLEMYQITPVQYIVSSKPN